MDNVKVETIVNMEDAILDEEVAETINSKNENDVKGE